MSAEIFKNGEKIVLKEGKHLSEMLFGIQIEVYANGSQTTVETDLNALTSIGGQVSIIEEEGKIVLGSSDSFLEMREQRGESFFIIKQGS